MSAAKTDDETERNTHLDAAMNYLLDAEEAGFFTTPDGFSRLQESTDLDMLREREGFRELMSRVAAE